jgi:uncharacterized protein YecT (DUF1311 family)
LSADELDQGVMTYCKNGNFEISSYDLVNGQPSEHNRTSSLKGGEHIYDHEIHKLKCEVGYFQVRAEFQLDTPSERGECGAAPGGYLTIWLDNTLFIDKALINNGCRDSIDKIEIQTSLLYEPVLVICGHTSIHRNPEVNGCFKFSGGIISSLKKFEPEPINYIINNGGMRDDFGQLLLSGPSYNCTNSISNIEKIICSSNILSALDMKLSNMYHEITSNNDIQTNDEIKKKQIEWLGKREMCGNKKANPYAITGCIKNMYLDRLNELRFYINGK